MVQWSFSISYGAYFYHCYSNSESVAVLKRARVERENILPFWIKNTQRFYHQEGTCSMHISCVRSQLNF